MSTDKFFISFGDSVMGIIDPIANEDEYSLDAQSGDLLTLLLNEKTAAIEPFVQIYNPDGTLLLSQGGSATVFLDNVALEETGTYKILVADSAGDETGDYSLSLQRTNNPTNAIPLAFGDSVMGTIEPSTELDMFTVNAQSGDLLTLLLNEKTAAIEPFVQIYNPDGTLLLSQGGSATVFLDNVALEETGTYKILVADSAGDETGDYSLSLQRTNNPTNAIPLAFGDSVMGTIEPSTELDMFTVNAQSGDLLTLLLNEKTAAIEPFVQIYNPDGTLLLSQGGSATVFLDNVALEETGTYKILVADSAGDETGDYSLSLQRTNNPTNAIPLAFGDSVMGTIEPSTELDMFTVNAQSGDLLTLLLNEKTAAIEPFVQIYNPDGTLLLSQGGSATVFLDNVALEETGTYKILVADSAGDETGDYSLSLQRTNNPTNAIPLAFGDSVMGTIEPSTELDMFTVNAQSGDLLTLLLNEKTAAIEPFVQIYNPDGTLLLSQGGSATVFLDNVALEETGTYKILVADSAGDETGDYSLSLQRTNNPTNAIPLAFGDSVMGTIEPSTELDMFTVNAQSGDLLTLLLNEKTAAIEPFVQIYNPDGTLLLSQGGSATVFLDNVALEETGTYKILVADSAGDETGDYSLSLQRTNNPTNAIPLAFGDSVMGTIEPSTELDMFTVNAQSGDLLTLLLNEKTAAIEPFVQIYNPDGTLLLSQGGSATVFLDNVALEETGTYKILVADSAGDETGDYSLSLQRTNNPTNAIPLAFGDSVMGTIDPSTEIETYVFSGSNGDLASIQVTEITSAIEPFLQIYNPDGSLLRRASGSATALLNNVPLEETGTYKIVVADSAGDETGDYNLTFNLTSQDPLPIDDTLIGTSGDDTLDGKIGNDRVEGRRGRDTIFGSSGDDTLLGNGGRDLLDGGTGNDSLNGGIGNDTLLGGYGRDNLKGSGGQDFLTGGEERDTLNGGNGNDTLNGGAANDRFCL